MFSVELKNNKEVYDFCMHNGITDINKFIQDCFKQGFDIRKYGLLGKMGGIEEKWAEKEVIVEKRVEVPVEIIKEVEKIIEVIKEVPVEKIVEVPVEVIKEVEKIVEVTKEIPVEKVVIKEVVKEVPVEKVVTKIEYISDKTSENELLSKIQELENEMSKKDEELDELRREISTKTTEIGTIREEFSTKMTEMDNFFQNGMSKKDEELDELRQKLDDPVTNNKVKMLQDTLQTLRGELQEKNEQIRELEKINRELLNGNTNQAYLMRGSNLNKRV